MRSKILNAVDKDAVSRSVRRASAAFVAMVLLAPAIGGASTMPGEEEYQVKVRYSDLNLTRPADDRILLARIEAAAFLACGGSSFSALEYKRVIQSSDCYRNSISRALRAVNSEPVSRLFQEHQ